MSEIGGRDLAKILSYVPQAKSYSYQFSVLDTVVMGRACHIWRYGVPGESDYAAAGEMLGRLGILHLSDKSYSELSGGEQQIVLIARALVQDASFIIMDEPASNLDFENQKRVLDVLKQLAGQGIGIIMSSHSPDHAFYCGASVVLINRDGSYSFGGSNTLLTEENLKKVYGVGLKILSGSDKQGNVIYTCGLEQGALPHLPSDARIGPKPKNY